MGRLRCRPLHQPTPVNHTLVQNAAAQPPPPPTPLLQSSLAAPKAPPLHGTASLADFKFEHGNIALLCRPLSTTHDNIALLCSKWRQRSRFEIRDLFCAQSPREQTMSRIKNNNTALEVINGPLFYVYDCLFRGRQELVQAHA